MCGITGFIDAACRLGEQDLLRRVTAMSDRIAHRGPDDSGAFADSRVGVALASRRLAIQDLGSEGHQPMTSADGRYVMVYNGEVYNFLELRAELEEEGVGGWRGRSDTEVLLAAFVRYGIVGALERCDGMFAFAAWDRERRVLILGRDRMGEKPLYYGWVGNTLLFASELKAMAAHPAWLPTIDRAALAAFMQYSYVPTPLSIYEGIRKLPPGHIVEFAVGALVPGNLPAAAPYWDSRTVAERAVREPFEGTEDEAVDTLERLLAQSVRRRLIADVPLGVFLSGGIDSSTVAAMMCRVSDRPVHSFTVGFDDQRYDESRTAEAIARRLGTVHTSIEADGEAPLRLVDEMPEVYDEPFADVSQLPTLLLARLTRRHVTTVLSGDGGDELFAGYPRYGAAAARWRSTVVRSAMVRKLGRRLAGCAMLGWFDRLRDPKGRPVRIGDKLWRRLVDLGADAPEALYEGFVSRWRTAVTPTERIAVGYYARPEFWPDLGAPEARMMYADAMTYLPDDLLVKIDRATMAVGLEGRAPFLAPEVVAFAWRLPVGMKLRGGTTKWLLRRLLARYLPQEIVAGPKRGFEPPLADWLRGPLRDWAEDLLAPGALAAGGMLDPVPVRQVWEEHLKGYRDWRFELWNVLMFQAWRRRWMV